MIKAENYVCILGWMCLDREHGGLDLKGNDLIVFAVIYGFCLLRGLYFCGSLDYLAEWANSTRQGIIKNILNLLDIGLIEKVVSTPTNKYFVKFENLPSDKNDDVNKVSSVNLVTNESKQSLHNNIDNNINNYTQDNYSKKKEQNKIYKSVILHFNEVCHTDYKSSNASVQHMITVLIDQGYNEDDMKKVIDHKYKQWGEHPFTFNSGMSSQSFLRPATLFSATKFESYINEARMSMRKENKVDSSNSKSASISVPFDASNRSTFSL